MTIIFKTLLFPIIIRQGIIACYMQTQASAFIYRQLLESYSFIVQWYLKNHSQTKKVLALVSNLEMSHYIFPLWNGLITIRKMLLVWFAHLNLQQISNLPPYTSTFTKKTMAPSNSLEPLKGYFNKSIRISFNFEICSLKHWRWCERKYFWVFWSLKINFLEVNRLTSRGGTLIASGLH